MIELQNLSAGYYGKAVVKQVSLSFMPGEVLVIVGPNGSGKSTLLKAALGMLPGMEGRITYDGKEIGTLSRKEIAKKAAFLTQSRNTPSITALRMVLHGRFPYLSYPRSYGKKDYEIAREAMAQTGSSAYEQRNVNELSGGMRQGVYLAMALAQDTETIFMDEPTTYLDINRQLQLMETARGLAKKGKAVVLVLHDLALALRLADRIAVMKEGTLAAWDKPERILETGILDQVFEVEVHQVETAYGRQYFCVPKKEG